MHSVNDSRRLQADRSVGSCTMVSTNSPSPVAMPVHVPTGHVVQQIVDERGTVRHVVLSPQHHTEIVAISSHPSGHIAPALLNSNSAQTYCHNVSAPFISTNYVTHPMDTTINANLPPLNVVSEASSTTYLKDERAQKQFSKLRRKLYCKQMLECDSSGDKFQNCNLTDIDSNTIDETANMTTDNAEVETEENEEEDYEQIIANILSLVESPKVCELSSRSALLQWSPPPKNSFKGVCVTENQLSYEVLLSEKIREMKYKSIYRGQSLSCRIQDLKPGQEYSVCLQTHLDEMQGSATDPVKFVTPPCEPDQPFPPKLHQRNKTSLHLKWAQVADNGSSLINYILEFSQNGQSFIECYKGKTRQYNIKNLSPGTGYTFRLAATNSVGQSLFSDPVLYYTFKIPPPKPLPPRLIEAGSSFLQLHWEKIDSSDEFTLQICDPEENYPVITYRGRDTLFTCTKLKRFTLYKFRLKAENEGGPSPWSEEVCYSTLVSRPSSPSKPTVKGRIDSYSFKLKWEPPADSGGDSFRNLEYLLEINSGSGYNLIYRGLECEALCENLTPGTTYQLRVCCTNSGGLVSIYSDPCTVTTEAVSPGPCYNAKLCGKAKPNSFTVRWTEPIYNGGAPILEYKVVVTEDISHCEEKDANTFKCRETEILLTGLNPGRMYSVDVRAVNRIGAGQWLENGPIMVQTAAAAPEPPEAPALKVRSPSHVSVQWTAPIENGSSIIEYQLQMATVHADGGDHFTTIYQGSELCYEIRNLSPFTTYLFRVRAANTAGTGLYSLVSSVSMPAAAPALVTSLRAEPSATTLKLWWDPPNNNGSEITCYYVYYNEQMIIQKTSIDNESTNNEESAKPGCHCTVSGLEPETTYKVRVHAENAIGTSNSSSILRVTTLSLPPEPPLLECAAAGPNFLKLKWGEGKNTKYVQYQVEMEHGRSHEFQTVYVGSGLIYKLNKLHEDTTYRFRICARSDAAGTGPYSKLYEFKTSFHLPNSVKTLRFVESTDNTSVPRQYQGFIEWSRSRNIFHDVIAYEVVLTQNNKDGVNEKVYRITDTKLSLENLEPNISYAAKVRPIRQTAKCDFFGQYSQVYSFSVPNSPITNATDVPPNSSGDHGPHNHTSLNHSNKTQPLHHSTPLLQHNVTTPSTSYRQSLFNKRHHFCSFSEQPIFYTIMLTLAGIIIAAIITSLL